VRRWPIHSGRTRAPRATKDLIEEDLFARRRDLFTDLDLVFLDIQATEPAKIGTRP
jgi:hypothetical protein